MYGSGGDATDGNGEGRLNSFSAVTMAEGCLSSIQAYDWSRIASHLFVTATGSVFDRPHIGDQSVPAGVFLADLFELVDQAKRAGKGGLHVLDINESGRRYRNQTAEAQTSSASRRIGSYLS
jgi:hypothetical protein